MFKEVKIYTIKCDECDFDVLSYSTSLGYRTTDDALSFAINEGWTETDGKHYCPECTAFIQEELEEECKQTALEEEHDYKQATR